MSRALKFYKHYFYDFYNEQDEKTRAKILYVINLVLELKIVPKTYLKRISGSQGIYEIRVKHGPNNFRIFCFFDERQLVVLMNCFQKKSKKIPLKVIRLAERLKKEYYEEKNSSEQF
jgi:phage-related protein